MQNTIAGSGHQENKSNLGKKKKKSSPGQIQLKTDQLKEAPLTVFQDICVGSILTTMLVLSSVVWMFH